MQSIHLNSDDLITEFQKTLKVTSYCYDPLVTDTCEFFSRPQNIFEMYISKQL